MIRRRGGSRRPAAVDCHPTAGGSGGWLAYEVNASSGRRGVSTPYAHGIYSIHTDSTYDG